MVAKLKKTIAHALPEHIGEDFFTHSSDLMVVLDPAGRVIHANAAFLHTMGYSAQEVTGQSLVQYVFADDRNYLVAALERVGIGTEPERIESRWMAREREAVRCIYTFQTSTDGKNILAIGRNLDAWHQSCDTMCKQHRAMERLIDERTRELKHANAELEAFNFSISHDLRAPLRAIGGFSKAVMEDYIGILDTKGQDYLRRIQVNCERMTTLTSYLLQLSRMSRQELKCKNVDLGKIADTIMTDLRASEPHRAVYFSRKGEMVVHGDRELLYLLMQNLLDNAWKYTSKRDSAEIVFSSNDEDDERVFSVSDNGVGYPASQCNRLFMLFQRLHDPDEYEGLGVGLAMAQRVVQRHGGRIWAESSEAGGATFRFTLATCK